MELTVRNDGLEEFSFTAALHTYLAAGPGAMVHGLDGASAEDNAAGGALVRLPSGPLEALGRRDIAVRDHDRTVTLTHSGGATLTLDRDGFADVVVWHPGEAHGLGDVPGPQAPGFVCLEPAQLSPVHLEPGGSWRAAAVMKLG
jgi:glucose-6-phosphate 1-epimerase